MTLAAGFVSEVWQIQALWSFTSYMSSPTLAALPNNYDMPNNCYLKGCQGQKSDFFFKVVSVKMHDPSLWRFLRPLCPEYGQYNLFDAFIGKMLVFVWALLSGEHILCLRT